MPAASVIVPAYNAAATLPRVLSALGAQGWHETFEVLVVDNGSTDATASIAKDAGGRVRCIPGPGTGPADARNAGAAAASGELLAFTDSDCFPTPGWLEAGARALDGVDFVQGAVAPEPDSAIGPYDRSLWVDRPSGLWETANLFVRRDAFDRVGGFEQWLTPREGGAMGEDAWLGWRLVRSGARSAFSAEALVHHAVFERDADEYVAERRRLEHFPEMVRRMPELRETLCWRGAFLSRRTAAFDAAAAALVVAAVTRRATPLAIALPYATALARRTRPYGSRAPAVAAVYAAAEAVGMASLLRGSVAARSLLL